MYHIDIQQNKNYIVTNRKTKTNIISLLYQKTEYTSDSNVNKEHIKLQISFKENFLQKMNSLPRKKK